MQPTNAAAPPYQGANGYSTSAMSAAMYPPLLKVIRFGNTFAKSNAGETKLATTLMPSVATANVSAASSARNQLSNLAEIWSGCSSTSPYTVKAAVVVTPATT